MNELLSNHLQHLNEIESNLVNLDDEGVSRKISDLLNKAQTSIIDAKQAIYEIIQNDIELNKVYDEDQEWVIQYVPKNQPNLNSIPFIVHAKSSTKAKEWFNEIMSGFTIISCEWYGPYIRL